MKGAASELKAQQWFLENDYQEDDVLFNFQVDASALKILVKALDRYIEKWPGGKPALRARRT